jgi:hypothetical protein
VADRERKIHDAGGTLLSATAHDARDPPLDLPWPAIRTQVLGRAQWVCQAGGVRTRLEVHHVVKRAQGGSDFDLDRLVAICPRCHAQTEAPYARGRLVITPLGYGRFMAKVTRGADKWPLHSDPHGFRNSP